ncbi:MAG: hypothetical protein ACK4K7_14005 [Allosphingosinicella sp.]|uniref:hypothetical protein n=1 Tax=Allosphingosinicella sp. TaxID=2823234 RepID=UPI003922E9B5
MPFDLNHVFRKTEEFLRRNIKPKAVSAAEERRRQRRNRAAARRLKRATAAAGVSGAGVAGAGALILQMGAAGLAAAGAAAVLAGGAALFWPIRPSGGGRISREELAEMLLDAEDWLLEQRKTIAIEALPAIDRIFQRLGDLHPHVEGLEPNGTVAWDIRRLVADHLPRLIDSYANLPESVREAEPELLVRLVEGLGTCDEELVRLCREASAAHLHSFEVQNRFLETRYREPERLRRE